MEKSFEGQATFIWRVHVAVEGEEMVGKGRKEWGKVRKGRRLNVLLTYVYRGAVMA